jgi:glycosyltransferase involved in cell wall biosynthesis
MKTAIVHDCFVQPNDTERVTEEIYFMVPNTTLFTTLALPGCVPARLEHVGVRTSWLQRLPYIDRYFELCLLLYPFGLSSLDLSGFDLVISSSSSYAKGVNASPDAVHVCYRHSPMRFPWSGGGESRGKSNVVRDLIKRAAIHGLARWDTASSRQPDHFVANSRVMAERIRRNYGRCAEVIYPPIQTKRFRASREREDYYLVVSPLVAQKRIDLAVQACTEMRKKLVVIGSGPDLERLVTMAGPTVTFIENAGSELVKHYMSRCRALLLPGDEDFATAPLEAASAGRPAIAYRGGGAAEIVEENLSGIFFEQQEPEHLKLAIQRFERQEWSPALIRNHSENFSVEVFQERFSSFLRRIGAPVAGKTGHGSLAYSA